MTPEELVLLEDQRQKKSAGRSFPGPASEIEPRETLTNTGIFLCIVNIMVGSGIVTLPYMMSRTGPYLGIAIFMIDAALATLSIYVIQMASYLTDAHSFPELASAAFGKRKSMYLINLLLMLGLYGPIVSNLMIVGDMGALTAMAVNPDSNYYLIKLLTIILGTTLIARQCFKKSLSGMRLNSVLAVSSVLLFLSLLFYRLL